MSEKSRLTKKMVSDMLLMIEEYQKDVYKLSQEIIELRKENAELTNLRKREDTPNKFYEAKAGDRVWSFISGWGVVVRVCGEGLHGLTELQVSFGEDEQFFYLDGKACKEDINPTLFWGEVEYAEPDKPLEDERLKR